MSGPKVYAPPPVYSMQVFDGKLNQIFLLQAHLKLIVSEAEKLQVADSQWSIFIDCLNDLNLLKPQIDKLLQSIVFDYKGTFGKEIYDQIYKEIESQINSLSKTIIEVEGIKTDFEKKYNDFQAFIAYQLFLENSNSSFEEFKNQIIQYLRVNLEATSPEIYEEANKKIAAVEFNVQNTKFEFGFNANLNNLQQKIIDHVIAKENTINSIRAEISNKVIEKYKDSGTVINHISKPDNTIPDDTKTLINGIKLLISNCDSKVNRNKYKKELDKLCACESLQNNYFFKELYNNIFETEKTLKFKTEILAILSSLNEDGFHPQILMEKQNLIKLCLSISNGTVVTKNEFEHLHDKFKQLKSNNIKFIEEEQVKNKELLFLKSQLIHSLQNLGYEVMEDMQVIDFEKENDFFLKIKNQENYLNLKFKDDGSMRYIFQMEENKEDLTIEQGKMKLHEMKITCSDFQSVLSDLAQMGLKLDLKSEKPIELDSLVSVPENLKAKIKKKSVTKQQQKQQEKKYLS